LKRNLHENKPTEGPTKETYKKKYQKKPTKKDSTNETNLPKGPVYMRRVLQKSILFRNFFVDFFFKIFEKPTQKLRKGSQPIQKTYERDLCTCKETWEKALHEDTHIGTLNWASSAPIKKLRKRSVYMQRDFTKKPYTDTHIGTLNWASSGPIKKDQFTYKETNPHGKELYKRDLCKTCTKETCALSVVSAYGVATVSRLLKNVGLFSRM